MASVRVVTVFVPVPNNKFLPPTLIDVNLSIEIVPAVILSALIPDVTNEPLIEPDVAVILPDISASVAFKLPS